MNNDRNLILKLNNYGYSQEVLEEVREFKTTGKIPDYFFSWSSFRTDVTLHLCSAGGCYLLCNIQLDMNGKVNHNYW